MDRLVLAGIAVIVTGTVAAGTWAPMMTGDGPHQGEPGSHDDQEQDRSFDLGSTHEHAYLFFYVNGSKMSLGPAYMENEGFAHFHGPDDIMHIHANGVTLRDVLSASRIGINESCVTFVPDEMSRCGDIQVFINGDPYAPGAVLDRNIRQGDTITITTAETIPERFRSRELPENYRVTGQPT